MRWKTILNEESYVSTRLLAVLGAMEGLANLAELPKRLEDLKKRLQDESEEAEKGRRRQQGCPRILSAACGAAMVAIGTVQSSSKAGLGRVGFETDFDKFGQNSNSAAIPVTSHSQG